MKKSVKKIFVGAMCAILLVVMSVVLFACDSPSSSSSKKKINMVNVELSSEEYAFIFNKNNDALKNQVNDIIAQKSDDIEQIKVKYLSATESEQTTFGKEYQTSPTNSDSEFVVATNLDFAPFEYTNGNKIAGIDIEVAELIANALDKTLVIVHMAFESVVEAVQTQEVYDIGMAALTITEDRAEVVNFSNPYFSTGQVVLTACDVTPFDYCTTVNEVIVALSSLSGADAKCGGQKGTTGEQYIKGLGDFVGYSNLNFGGYDSVAQAIEDMLNGNIAFVIVDKAVAISLLKVFNA